MSSIRPWVKSLKIIADETTEWFIVPQSQEGEYFDRVVFDVVNLTSGSFRVETTYAHPNEVLKVNDGGNSDFVKGQPWDIPEADVSGNITDISVTKPALPMTAFRYVTSGGGSWATNTVASA